MRRGQAAASHALHQRILEALVLLGELQLRQTVAVSGLIARPALVRDRCCDLELGDPLAQRFDSCFERIMLFLGNPRASE